jgi:Flp pilus assembly protein TadG
MIEFALVVPLLATLLFGMLTGGLVLNRRMAVSQAAREGARYGTTVPWDQCVQTTRCSNMNWAQLVQNVTLNRSGGATTLANICVALVSGSGTNPIPISQTHTTKSTLTPCFVDNSADQSKRVQVSVTFTDKIQAVFKTIPVTVTVKSVSRLEE